MMDYTSPINSFVGCGVYVSVIVFRIKRPKDEREWKVPLIIPVFALLFRKRLITVITKLSEIILLTEAKRLVRAAIQKHIDS